MNKRTLGEAGRRKPRSRRDRWMRIKGTIIKIVWYLSNAFLVMQAPNFTFCKPASFLFNERFKFAAYFSFPLAFTGMHTYEDLPLHNVICSFQGKCTSLFTGAHNIRQSKTQRLVLAFLLYLLTFSVFTLLFCYLV